MKQPLKILINAQLLPGGHSGGVEQFVIGLVWALGRLQDGDEEYIIIGPGLDPMWLSPYLGRNQRIVAGPQLKPGRWDGAKRLLGPLRGTAGKILRKAREVMTTPSAATTLPESNGFYESLGGQVIHFPFQSFVRCALPSVFNPHDLQHLHFPQFFSPQTVAGREMSYRASCGYAHAIVTDSQCVKADLIRQYDLDGRKIYAIRWGSPTELYEPITSTMLQTVREKFALPDKFTFYPAQTWPHKNHLRLLEAIRMLRDRNGVSVNLVCTGRKNDFWGTIKKRISELGLKRQVSFLGYVDPHELRCLYKLAQFVVFPSLFEGGGFPVIEAFSEGVPVACSTIAPLEEYGGKAVLQFDPASVTSIAEAVLRLSADAELRATLRQNGSVRRQLFNWERMGKAYRALYRKVAGCSLSDEDERLLGECDVSADSLVGSLDAPTRGCQQ